MAHGEADHGCAQGESCRPGQHDQTGSARPHRRLVAAPCPSEQVARGSERADDELTVPRQRSGQERPEGCPGVRATEPPAPEPPGGRTHGVEPAGRDASRGCRSELAGWAGAHRHGPVRPGRRPVRRERPPHRWC
ncbi:hypothetical protein [Micromonospora sp. KC721]|uniref:hypothetical protein n=1 Tax=Micromonospora sp. KC721 TaxID=2530380 RepID=UPI00104A15BE|nr:hypothetical protein [Micromonospora sp. KC721]TDB73774.1 hypothetical protein E1182_20390 [Micromonospora sp. KC721]